MPADVVLHENSKRLKKLFAPFNPLFGDSGDPDRFLFKVHGIRKASLPTAMQNLPFIKKLISCRSLSKFIRTSFYKDNFHSVSHLLSCLKHTRQRYDFLYWISQNYPSLIPEKGTLSLVRKLRESHLSGKPIRLIVRKNEDQDIFRILNLFVVWFKSYSKPGLNVMSVSPSLRTARENRDFFLELSDCSSHPSSLRFTKEEISSTLHLPSLNSRFWFVPASNPDSCRSRDFSILILHDTGLWKNTKAMPSHRIIPAAFPAVLPSADSVIILESGPCKRNSFFRKEWKAAEKKLSPFSPLTIPWHENPENILKFDFPEERLKFHSLIMKFRNRKSFPHFPMVKGKVLYRLWEKGISLEAIYWYASESSFYKYPSQFLNRYPS